MKTKFVLLCMLMITCVFGQNDVEVRIVTQKSTYYVSEAIFVKFSYRNRSGELVEMPSIFYADYYNVTDDQGTVYKPSFTMIIESWMPFYLFPEDTFTTYLKLTTAFDQSLRNKQRTQYGLPAGKYTIQFKYIDEEIRLISNQLELKIIPPPEEEVAAFKLYNEARYLFYNTKDNSQKHSASLKVVDRYPESVYAPSALSLARITSTSDEEKFGWRLIREYSNCYETWYVLNRFLLRYESKKEKFKAENFLREVINTAPGTFVAKDAQNRLKEIEALTLEEWATPWLKKKKRLKEYRESLKKD